MEILVSPWKKDMMTIYLYYKWPSKQTLFQGSTAPRSKLPSLFYSVWYSMPHAAYDMPGDRG